MLGTGGGTIRGCGLVRGGVPLRGRGLEEIYMQALPGVRHSKQSLLATFDLGSRGKQISGLGQPGM